MKEGPTADEQIVKTKDKFAAQGEVLRITRMISVKIIKNNTAMEESTKELERIKEARTARMKEEEEAEAHKEKMRQITEAFGAAEKRKPTNRKP